MSETPVKVYIYDISKGLARTMSRALIGKQIDGVWHTGIVAFGQEFFFGGDGINNCPPSGTILGPPDTIVNLGNTQIPFDMFSDYLFELSQTSFKPSSYHLLEHNCNNFSSEVAQFLTGQDIPSYITNLPAEVLQTPMGAMLKTFIDSMSHGQGHPMFGGNTNANNQNNVDQPPSTEAASSSVDNHSKSDDTTPSSPSIVTFTDAKVEFSSLKDTATGSEGDKKRLQEICEYVSNDQCSWSVGKTHIQLIENLLLNNRVESDKKIKLLGILQQLVLNEDIVSMMLHYNMHGIMEYACNISQLRRGEQVGVVRVLSNCCQSQKGVDWLLSREEFTMESLPVTNRMVTGGCCVFCLLQENCEVREAGATLSFNVTQYKVTDDTAVEIGSAVLQCLMSDLPEKTAHHCLSALKTLMSENQEVTDLACVMGVELDKYKAMSPRIAEITKVMEPLLQ